MSTTASQTELALIFGILGGPLGILPLGASAFATWRPSRASATAAAVGTLLPALAALAFSRGAGVLTLVALPLLVSGALWGLERGHARKPVRILATIASALPLAYVLAVFVIWA